MLLFLLIPLLHNSSIGSIPGLLPVPPSDDRKGVVRKLDVTFDAPDGFDMAVGEGDAEEDRA